MTLQVRKTIEFGGLLRAALLLPNVLTAFIECRMQRNMERREDRTRSVEGDATLVLNVVFGKFFFSIITSRTGLQNVCLSCPPVRMYGEPARGQTVRPISFKFCYR